MTSFLAVILLLWILNAKKLITLFYTAYILRSFVKRLSNIVFCWKIYIIWMKKVFCLDAL